MHNGKACRDSDRRARRSDARFVVVRVVARFGSVRFVVVVVVRVVVGGGGGGAGR